MSLTYDGVDFATQSTMYCMGYYYYFFLFLVSLDCYVCYEWGMVMLCIY